MDGTLGYLLQDLKAPIGLQFQYDGHRSAFLPGDAVRLLQFGSSSFGQPKKAERMANYLGIVGHRILGALLLKLGVSGSRYRRLGLCQCCLQSSFLGMVERGFHDGAAFALKPLKNFVRRDLAHEHE